MEHNHITAEEENRKPLIIRLAAAVMLFLAGLITDISPLFWISYLIAGFDVLIESAKNIAHGKIFDESFLMSVASLAAIVIGDGAEAPAVMILYQFGEMLQDMAADKAVDRIAALAHTRPDRANLLKDGAIIETSPENVKTGDLIAVNQGERVPLDGVVTEGSSFLNMSALTGESLPTEIKKGDVILSGSVNINSPLTVEVTAEYSSSTISRILELTQQAAERKSSTEKFITRFSRYYTPVVCAVAAAVAVLPPLFGAGSLSSWVSRALIFLVISCPCAIVISIPVAFVAGLGKTAEDGVLIKGSSSLENLANADTFVFDKTGTLTEGKLKVVRMEIIGTDMSEEEVLAYAAAAESTSGHPIAKALIESSSANLKAENIIEIPGKGISADVNGHRILVGNEKLCGKCGLESVPYTTVLVSADGKLTARIIIADRIKSNAEEALKALKSSGVKRTVILSGDKPEAVRLVADKLGIDEAKAELLPEEKLKNLEAIPPVRAYVGDGINDSPSLAMADVGIAMGALGSDAAIEAADVVIMSDNLSKIPAARNIAAKTARIAKENIIFALGVKLLFMVLGIFGISNMWMAVFADTGVAVLAILNSLRALK